MRHSATRALLERDDVIIVASVSCIYGIGSVETYGAMTQDLHVGKEYDQRKVMADLIAQQYKRNDQAFQRGAFRVRGDTLEVFPAHLEDRAWKLSFFGEELEAITEFDPLTGEKTDSFERIRIYANSHYVTPRPTMQQAVIGIKKELRQRLDQLVAEGKLLEAQRLEQRTNFDIEMLEATGVCNGIENYSRYLTGRAPGEPPPTLFEFIPDTAIVFADESHVSVPQIGGMYKGDYRRKFTLAEHGFRLPAAGTPARQGASEGDARAAIRRTVFRLGGPAGERGAGAGGRGVGHGGDRSVIGAPGGLLDPVVEIRPVESCRVDDRLDQGRRSGWRSGVLDAGQRGLASERAKDWTEVLAQQGSVRDRHSDIDTTSGSRSCATFGSGRAPGVGGSPGWREGVDSPGMRAGGQCSRGQGGVSSGRRPARPDHRASRRGMPRAGEQGRSDRITGLDGAARGGGRTAGRAQAEGL